MYVYCIRYFYLFYFVWVQFIWDYNATYFQLYYAYILNYFCLKKDAYSNNSLRESGAIFSYFLCVTRNILGNRLAPLRECLCFLTRAFLAKRMCRDFSKSIRGIRTCHFICYHLVELLAHTTYTYFMAHFILNGKQVT